MQKSIKYLINNHQEKKIAQSHEIQKITKLLPRFRLNPATHWRS